MTSGYLEASILDVEKLAHGSYRFIVDHFGEEKLNSRYNTIIQYLKLFIQSNELEDKVTISQPVVDNLVIDYFVDIYRIKEFQDIKYINDAKIYAYTAYWLLRRKPLQLVTDNANENDFAFINEQMVASYLFGFLFSNPDNASIVKAKEPEFQEFEKNLLYSLMYRDFSPKSLEMMIYAFTAGRAYQYSVDFSNAEQ